MEVFGTSNNTNEFIYLSIKKDSIHKDLEELFTKHGKFSHIINCIAEISPKNENIENVLIINAYLPKVLSYYGNLYDFKLYHISTNGIFSWDNWPYSISSVPNDMSLYGMTKLLWEVVNENSITIRTSIVGIDTNQKKWLIHWLLETPDDSSISWYPLVYWNGITTLTLAKIIEYMINSEFESKEVLHIIWERISKYQMLIDISDIFWKKIKIDTDLARSENRTLVSSQLPKEITALIPSFKNQIEELKIFHAAINS